MLLWESQSNAAVGSGFPTVFYFWRFDHDDESSRLSLLSSSLRDCGWGKKGENTRTVSRCLKTSTNIFRCLVLWVSCDYLYKAVQMWRRQMNWRCPQRRAADVATTIMYIIGGINAVVEQICDGGKNRIDNHGDDDVNCRCVAIKKFHSIGRSLRWGHLRECLVDLMLFLMRISMSLTIWYLNERCSIC